MKHRQDTQMLVQSIVRNVVPAYVGPVIMVSIISRIIPDRDVGRALADARFTTIAVPSACAALFMTLVLWRYVRNKGSIPRSILGMVLGCALACGVLAAGMSALLVGANVVAPRLFADAIPSAALAGAITAGQTIKRFRTPKN
jgi:hypothetical protein